MEIEFLFDKSTLPTQKRIEQLLGDNAKLYNKLDRFCETELEPIIYDWKFYTKKSGWTRKTLLKKRNLFFLSPKVDMFSVTFVFGDKAVTAVENSDLPERIKTDLNQARKYMEGRGIRIDITASDDLEIVKKLLLIKLEN